MFEFIAGMFVMGLLVVAGLVAFAHRLYQSW